MRRLQQIMGMPISIDIPSAQNDKVFGAVFKRLSEIDACFSTYQPNSEVSRFAKGEKKEAALSAELKQTLQACRDWQEKTGGYFSAWASGSFDPSGYVKGWAIAEAGKVIAKMGFKTFCIGAGGDILARSHGSKIWTIGVEDPADRSKIIKSLSLKNGAVCTSGNYLRGNHIINPKSGQPAKSLKSATVYGPDIITADVLATAVFAAGKVSGRKILEKFPAYDALLVA